MNNEFYNEMMELQNQRNVINMQMEDKIWKNGVEATTLEEVLNQFTKDDLINTAKFYRIKVNSSSKKDDIITKLLNELIPAMENYTINMEPSQYLLLNKIANIDKSFIYIEDIQKDYSINQISYFVDNMMLYPVKRDNKRALIMFPEIKSIYSKSIDEDMERIHRFNLMRRRVICGMMYFYGVISKQDLIDTHNKATNDILPLEQLELDLKELISYANMVNVQKDIVSCFEVHEDEIDTILEEQNKRSDLEYRLYNPDDYLKSSMYGNIPMDPYNEKLLKYFYELTDNQGLSVELLNTVILMFRHGAEVNSALNLIARIQEKELSQKEATSLFDLLNNVCVSTPEWYLKGHSPYQLYERERSKYNARFNDPDNVISFRTGSKIGRNDLCPCGSGKKFKMCCGN